MNESLLDVLKTRRSVRDFSNRLVDDATLSEILEAGTYAPTGRNRQAPIIVVVRDAETRETLRRMNAEILGAPQTDPFYGAPIILVVLSDPAVSTHVEDGSLVIGNIMNAAHALSVDTCWIHRAREEFAAEEGKRLLQKWGIDKKYVGVGHVAMGYRKGAYPTAAPRKEHYIYYV